VLIVQRERVLAARRQDRADCAEIGHEEQVEHDGYNDQDPASLARQITDAADLFSNVLARLRADDWNRTVLYNYPEPTNGPYGGSRYTPSADLPV
jgi:hypothetical protein